MDVVVGQLQSRRVFGRKGNVTIMVIVFQVRTCQIVVHVGYDNTMTVSLGYLSQCDGEDEFKFLSRCNRKTLKSNHHTLEIEKSLEH